MVFDSDGAALAWVRRSGIDVAWLSGRLPVDTRRAAELGSRPSFRAAREAGAFQEVAGRSGAESV
jgi:hypothetical protein